LARGGRECTVSQDCVVWPEGVTMVKRSLVAVGMFLFGAGAAWAEPGADLADEHAAKAAEYRRRAAEIRRTGGAQVEKWHLDDQLEQRAMAELKEARKLEDDRAMGGSGFDEGHKDSKHRCTCD
jgi:hypothetical protein